MTENLLEARALTKHFPLSTNFVGRILGSGKSVVHAVDDVELDVRKGEILGLVGESGCGKTTLGRMMLRLVEPTSGTLSFEGRDITTMRESHLRPLRQRMQLVFQDPHASLNPAMSVGDAVAHPLVVHGVASWSEARARAAEVLEEVGLAPSKRFFDKRPAELSGGQKQRVVIARAIVTRPSFVVADEPVSMLDMSVRAKVLQLLLDLKKKYDLTLVFITHDLATARFLCDRIAIMYLGKVVEVGDAKKLLSHPEHPYAKALLAAVPEPDPTRRRSEEIPHGDTAAPSSDTSGAAYRRSRRAMIVSGEVPDAVRPPAGCRFHPRCPVATPACGHTGADLREVAPEFAWKLQGKDAFLPHAPVDAEARVRGAVIDRRPVLWDAVAETQRDPAGLRVVFREPQPIGMRHRPDGREVRCVLYPNESDEAAR